jgi:hypothetical protein
MEVDWDEKSRGQEGLQVNRDHEGLQIVEKLRGPATWDREDGGEGEGRRKRILGLSVPTFWILVLISVLIIAGGVGGGIGAGLAAQKGINFSNAAGTSRYF